MPAGGRGRQDEAHTPAGRLPMRHGLPPATGVDRALDVIVCVAATGACLVLVIGQWVDTRLYGWRMTRREEHARDNRTMVRRMLDRNLQ